MGASFSYVWPPVPPRSKAGAAANAAAVIDELKARFNDARRLESEPADDQDWLIITLTTDRAPAELRSELDALLAEVDGPAAAPPVAKAQHEDAMADATCAVAAREDVQVESAVSASSTAGFSSAERTSSSPAVATSPEEITLCFTKLAQLEQQLELLRTIIASGVVSNVTLSRGAKPGASPSWSPASSVPMSSPPSPPPHGPPLALMPPPPPPPPAADWKQPRQKADAAPAKLSDDEVDRIVRQEISLSQLTPLAQQRAVANFIGSYSANTRPLLTMLATHYPFLIRALPLKPVECTRRASMWERLFRDMPPAEAKKLRTKKCVEICTLSVDAIDGEIAKIRLADEVRRRKELEVKQQSSTKQDLLRELSTRFERHEASNMMLQAERELCDLEVVAGDELTAYL